MSLLSVLKTIGKDLSHVGSWIDDALRVVEPIIAVVDPEIGTIIQDIEDILNLIPPTVVLNASTVQSVVTSSAVVNILQTHTKVGTQ